MSARAARLAILAACAIWLGAPVGASQQADPPHVLERKDPALPDSLVRLRLSGWVQVWVRIDSSGRVVRADARDREASRFCFGPHADGFDRAAVTAARGYRFAPGIGVSSPAGEFVLPIPFHPPADSAAGRSYTLVGRVLESGGNAAVPKAWICLPGEGLQTIALGYHGYRLSLPPGKTRLMFVSADGYTSVGPLVWCRPGVTDTMDFRLERCPRCVRHPCDDVPSHRRAP